MGKYLGYISIKNNHYNFRPIAEVQERSIISLSSEALKELLPDSTKRDIDFAFPVYDEERMKETFCEASPVLFEFTLDELQPNLDRNGQRCPTGYKVQALDMIESGKIRSIHDDMFYRVVRVDSKSDFENDSNVVIELSAAVEDEQVYINYDEVDGFLAGPYEVKYRDYDSVYYVKPQIKENKYTISGYRDGSYVIHEISYTEWWGDTEHNWRICIPRTNAQCEQLDVIKDNILIEGFHDSIKNSLTTNGVLRIDDISALVDRYEQDMLSGDKISDTIRKNRLSRVVSILTSEADVADTLRVVNDFVCDLLVRQKDSQSVEDWLRVLLDNHPELIERLRESRAIKEKIDVINLELDELYQQKSELEHEITQKQAEAAEAEKATREGNKSEILKAELLEMDSEYTELREKLEAVKQTRNIVGSIAELQDKQTECQREVEYLQTHKTHLEHDTSELELKFKQIISSQHEEMVGIAFDGFMASKMLHAAAQWEAEEATQHHKELVDKVNSIAAVDKTPEELIDYLCRTIRIVRPTYSKNAIVNIAICITQGFLTVFSGEPGCGKTSICNIFGEVLGLNRIANVIGCDEGSSDTGKRYIPVAVERGWTSKRDFVGYYNPLSKTFDKSNRRVYDALHLLDAEKRCGMSRFPFVILLDEANLSPMEYYWSDFMNICDDLGPQSKVNLGENYVFAIPETLHFVATINNDDTTYTLSPRLIDRAWVILLPQQNSMSISSDELPESCVEVITWSSLSDAFIPRKEGCVFSDEIQRIYSLLIAKLREKRFYVSPRINKAIRSYWVVAAKYFEADESSSGAEITALDYAVAQRILPKIAGNGEEFKKWLEDLRAFCKNNELIISANIINDIIERGKQMMSYYQFFC